MLFWLSCLDVITNGNFCDESCNHLIELFLYASVLNIFWRLFLLAGNVGWSLGFMTFSTKKRRKVWDNTKRHCTDFHETTFEACLLLFQCWASLQQWLQLVGHPATRNLYIHYYLFAAAGEVAGCCPRLDVVLMLSNVQLWYFILKAH